ncbi:MAG: MATE family efflux transporter [Marinifilaceae bacterium]
MNQIKDLTNGNIFSQILKLAIPIIATSFVQMAYNMTDMAWLGHVGSSTVSAVGTAAYLTWLGQSLMYITKTGVEVGISQSIGRKDFSGAIKFAQNAVTLSLLISGGYALVIALFATPIVDLFNLNSEFVKQTAVDYLHIVACGMIFTYTNLTFSGIYIGAGNTRTPFWVNAFGLLMNMILDPLLIFGWGDIPAMGAEGAAIATVGSQIAVFALFLYFLLRKRNPLGTTRYIGRLRKSFTNPIFKVGGPVALQSAFFALFAIALARVMIDIAGGDEIPLSVQSIGAQIEALSWMTAIGFSTALGSFTGQNYGAGQWQRIQKGFFITVGIAATVGLISTLLFLFAGTQIFGLFLNAREQHVIDLGVVYLIILGVSQIFMCIEIASTGAFNGIGKAIPPAIIGIAGNFLRIPMAFLLSYGLVEWLPDFTRWIQSDNIPVTGVWWGMTLTSILKGIVLFVWFFFILFRHPNNDHPLPFQNIWIKFIPSRIRQQTIVSKRMTSQTTSLNSEENNKKPGNQ